MCEKEEYFIQSEIDEYGDVEFYKDISLRLRCRSYNIKNLNNIENDILEVLNDKAFDGLCYFEKINKKDDDGDDL